MKVAFKNARLIDGTDGLAQERMTVVVDGGKIVEVSKRDTIADEPVVDLKGKTLMPGLADAHVHFYSPFCHFRVYNPDYRFGFMNSTTVSSMRDVLASGVTSARDLGGMDAGFADAEEAGLIDAPRLKGSAVQFMTPTNGSIDQMDGWGGYVSKQGESLKTPGVPDPHCDGPWEVRKKIREVILAGADVIKFGSTGCLGMRSYDHNRPTFTREEIDVFVDEGRRQNMKVHCHAFGGEGLHDAIHAGVSCIEHGPLMTDDLIETMVEKETWWVPTFWVIDLHSKIDPHEKDRDFMKACYEKAVVNLGKAYKAGVKIAMGSDGGSHDPDRTASLIEPALMSDAGMKTSDVIAASTRLSTELIGTGDITGTIEVGKMADLIILDGDPLEDISILQKTEKKLLVMKSGKPVGGTWLDPEAAIMGRA